jgi:murein DD-endopeptidase MepM/ murein hydrolase activator NlpD
MVRLMKRTLLGIIGLSFSTIYADQGVPFLGFHEIRTEDHIDAYEESSSGVSFEPSEEILATAREVPLPLVESPVAGVISSGFGPRWGRMHRGIDFSAASGTPILALEDGIVVRSTLSTTYGYVVIIRHSLSQETLYAHMLQKSFGKVGQTIKKGELIGFVGSTGRSTGPHLHFEVRSFGKAVNPLGRYVAIAERRR